MNTYNEIFLPIELNKALQNILCNVHQYYREHEENIRKTFKEEEKSKRLREIYDPILNCPELEDELEKNFVWFNAWKKMHTGKPDVYFIKDCYDTSKRILNIYREKTNEYKEYVSSLNTLAKNYNINEKERKQRFLLDYAFLITTKKNPECDVEMASEYIRDYFVYLNFEKVTELFKDINFSEHHNTISAAFIKSEKDGNEKIIEILKRNHDWLSKNKNVIDNIVPELTNQLNSSWQCKKTFGHDLVALIENNMILDSNHKCLKKEAHEKNVIRLINYYFWVKLAFQEWNVLLYLPGVIAKEFEGIPLGVNIGLKKMVSLEILLFLKRAVLLFFTRESVDFFEEEAKEKTRIITYLNKLLSDFQHTLLQKVMETILWCGKEMLRVTDKNDLEEFYYKPFTNLCGHIMTRGTYLDNLASYIRKREQKELPTQSAKEIKKFVTNDVFVNSGIVSGDDFKKSLENWRHIVTIQSVCDWKVKTHSGAIETILENLMHNSLIKHIELDDDEIQPYSENNFLKALCDLNMEELRKYFRVHIILGKQDGVPFLVYYDTGKGFKLDAIRNLSKWIKTGPSEKELEEDNKGYAYWLIGRISEHIESDIKFTICTKTQQQTDMGLQNSYFQKVNIVNRDALKLENLVDGNIRLIHQFIFKSG